MTFTILLCNCDKKLKPPTLLGLPVRDLNISWKSASANFPCRYPCLCSLVMKLHDELQGAVTHNAESFYGVTSRKM